MYLWWPDTMEEAHFVANTYPSEDIRHVGWIYHTEQDGVIHSDGSVGVGMAFLSNSASGGQFFPGSGVMSTINNNYCILLHITNITLGSSAPCLNTRAICKQRIGKAGIQGGPR